MDYVVQWEYGGGGLDGSGEGRRDRSHARGSVVEHVQHRTRTGRYLRPNLPDSQKSRMKILTRDTSGSVVMPTELAAAVLGKLFGAGTTADPVTAWLV